MFVISVTYGTNPHQIYAEASDIETAKALKAAALERKYTDAEIIPKAKFLAMLKPKNPHVAPASGFHRGGWQSKERRGQRAT